VDRSSVVRSKNVTGAQAEHGISRVRRFYGKRVTKNTAVGLALAKAVLPFCELRQGRR